ncbi:hypothetical protein FGM00_08905 [Aggregatimonas sangjinii]|uniref:Uncharacterized protein n=1 Tax=Aggregatimonas sangjinii TaxID=2583587 RepID=A0A5B7SPV9_9FLAO|nr:hypothetical protein [Aggregatimonas sangjinii]QCX00222.1 hypothetical protein FGM00_08905 [Aggregatimonas sangjinii]
MLRVQEIPQPYLTAQQDGDAGLEPSISVMVQSDVPADVVVFEESLKVFISPENYSFKDESYVFSLSYLHYNSKNELIKYDLNENGIGIGITTTINTKANLNLSAKCQTMYIVITDGYSDGSSDSYIIGTYQECDGGGGGGGGNWDGGNLVDNEEDILPPSCKSFDFKQDVDGLNWQESAVKGIYFKVYLTYTTPPYLEYSYTVRLNEPVLFGAPMEGRHGELPSGKLASASAHFLNEMMKKTVDKYDRTRVNPSVVEAYFKDELRDEYNKYIVGGRVNTNYMGNLNPTTYRATTDGGFDGCEKND